MVSKSLPPNMMPKVRPILNGSESIASDIVAILEATSKARNSATKINEKDSVLIHVLLRDLALYSNLRPRRK